MPMLECGERLGAFYLGCVQDQFFFFAARSVGMLLSREEIL
jgi:hypothetical protein